MGQVISLDFGLVHQPPSFNYDFNFDDLDDEIKEQLPEDTAELLAGFTEEELLFDLLASPFFLGYARCAIWSTVSRM